MSHLNVSELGHELLHDKLTLLVIYPSLRRPVSLVCQALALETNRKVASQLRGEASLIFWVHLGHRVALKIHAGELVVKNLLKIGCD